MHVSKIERLCRFLDGTQHVGDHMTVYFAARSARDACRRKNAYSRHASIKKALKVCNVVCAMTDDGKTRIYNSSSNSEITI